MEAPEKIYFTSYENGTHYYTEGIPFERKSVEYVRKDAFIEKICKYLFENYHGEKLSLKMIEDFKNYIKE